MKFITLFSLFTLLCSLTDAFAQNPSQPVLVGHRGSAWGVENTREAFLNGAKIYPYLECDVRMTADSVFVIMHDETTERLGGKLKVAESTLRQLKEEELKQTRHDTLYTAGISTFEEYLDDCKSTGVKPLIEFKWTPGINSDDQSMIPALIEMVKEKGFYNDCIIITSMKPCLEFVMKNYPEVNVQFLGGGKWRDSLDWILKNNIDVDLIHTAISKDDVDMLHQKGLKVNTWTVDNPQRFEELKEMGVDYVTTNRLPY